MTTYTLTFSYPTLAIPAILALKESGLSLISAKSSIETMLETGTITVTLPTPTPTLVADLAAHNIIAKELF